MLFVSDVHGAFDELKVVARCGEPLVILGDFLNFVDYRTHEGMLAEVMGREFVAELSRLREAGDRVRSRELWNELRAGREDEIAAHYERLIVAAYTRAASALAGTGAYVTYGNVDRPDLMREMFPDDVRFLDGDVVEIDGFSVGIVGGGVRSLGVPGEVGEEAMAEKLDALGPVDILGTHVAPAIPALSGDVIGGRAKQSVPVLDYLRRHSPRWHYFGDIHQPQATTWRVGATTCINVGYFRATGRAVRHG
jgi:Icc-related predicted phosphoesterase